MDIDRFIIDIEELDAIQMASEFIENSDLREKNIYSNLAINIAKKYFENIDDYQFDIDTSSSLSSMPGLLGCDTEISDFYVNGNYVDIRLYFDKDNIEIPISHFKSGIIPSAYMFIKLEEDLSSGFVSGFVLPESIEFNQNEVKLVVKEEDFVSFYDIEPFLNKNEQDIDDNYEILVQDFIAGKLENDVDFYKLLLKNRNAREYLKLAIKTSQIFRYVSKYDSGVIDESNAEILNEHEVQDLEVTPLELEDSEVLEFTDVDDNVNAEVLDLVEESSSVNSDLDILYQSSDLQEVDEYTEDTEDTYNEINDTKLDSQGISYENHNKKLKALPLIAFATIILAGGFLAYNHLNSKSESIKASKVNKPVEKAIPIAKTSDVAMPVEIIENIEDMPSSQEAIPVSIPAIEKNLSASISISNLSINWEIPTSYASNPLAKKYFLKLGKIIQLNLKTELLLLSKPPISNKIALELYYDKKKDSFDIKAVTISSGEKTIDDLVVRIVKSLLSNSFKYDMTTFNKLSGNPILIIRL